MTRQLTFEHRAHGRDDGASEFYAGQQHVQRYSDQIGLALTIGALLWSGIAAVRTARRQRRRDRSETHYEAARRLARAAEHAGSAIELAEARRALVDARERAVAELEAERLDANDAFMVLQRRRGRRSEARCRSRPRTMRAAIRSRSWSCATSGRRAAGVRR